MKHKYLLDICNTLTYKLNQKRIVRTRISRPASIVGLCHYLWGRVDIEVNDAKKVTIYPLQAVLTYDVILATLKAKSVSGFKSSWSFLNYDKEHTVRTYQNRIPQSSNCSKSIVGKKTNFHHSYIDSPIFCFLRFSPRFLRRWVLFANKKKSHI